MVQSLEQYVAEATQAYKPASTAVQNQLNSLSGQLDTATQTINKNYAQHQDTLNRQRNAAASAASMQAAGSGGSFGGAANLANRKYYEQNFVPAQTQLQTNQSNELANARQDYENQRTNLNSQLANIEAQANEAALRQYWADVEAEKQREAQLRAQREAQAAQNAYYNYLMQAAKQQNSQPQVKVWDFGNGYQIVDNGGEAQYRKNGQVINAGVFLQGTGANGANWDLWNDVWNNIRTTDVGSDTVEAYNRKNPQSSPGTAYKYS